jgi:vacuolar protein sorting-associated protein 13A/C
LYYAWDYPGAKDKKVQLSIAEHPRAVDLHEIGDLMPFKFYVRYFD